MPSAIIVDDQPNFLIPSAASLKQLGYKVTAIWDMIESYAGIWDEAELQSYEAFKEIKKLKLLPDEILFNSRIGRNAKDYLIDVTTDLLKSVDSETIFALDFDLSNALLKSTVIAKLLRESGFNGIIITYSHNDKAEAANAPYHDYFLKKPEVVLPNETAITNQALMFEKAIKFAKQNAVSRILNANGLTSSSSNIEIS